MVSVNKITEAVQRTNKVVNQTNVKHFKNESDTLKLWEGYRDQALLWRSIALLQIPTTLAAIILTIVIWSSSSPKLIVPRQPAPGIHAVQDIPDTEFLDVGTEFVNLIASYQPAVARRQYMEAEKMIIEPLQSKFKAEMLGEELKAIESTARTQIFFVDPSKTTIKRKDGSSEVSVGFTGDRLKIIAGKELPMITSTYTVSMKTIPRNKTNPFGIVVTNIQAESK